MKNPNKACAGFILPYTLSVIAILSIIILVGSNVLERGQSSASRLRALYALEQLADEAEVQLKYTFLVTPFSSEGMDLSGRVLDQSDVMLGIPPDESDLSSSDIWSSIEGKTQISLSRGTAIITYQDADALISLNVSSPTLIEKAIQSFGIPSEKSRSLAAKLEDYRDNDHSRGFLGGERADYRLKRMPAPTNSPPRHFTELGNVLEWDETNLSRKPTFLSLFTLYRTAPFPREQSMPDRIAQIVAADSVLNRTNNYFDVQLTQSTYPGARGQFVLEIYPEDMASALIRVIEVERTATAADRPYTSRRLSQRVLTNAQYNPETSNDEFVQLSLPAANNP